jgi:putative serine/threonine protein kinase
LVEGKEVPLRKLLGTGYSRALTYPISNRAEAEARIRELSAIGITAVRFRGPTLIDGIPILGKGCVGVVTQAILDGFPVALKIRRIDADRASMNGEGRLLRLANSVGVGPRLLVATGNFLAMQLFDGMPLFRWAESSNARSNARVKQVLKHLLVSCSRLDAIGLDHGELSHAPKNVLVSQAGKPCIVDFESASTVRRVGNVTSLLQYFLFGKISTKIRASKIFPQKRTVLKTLTRYKREPSVESFQDILKALDLL